MGQERAGIYCFHYKPCAPLDFFFLTMHTYYFDNCKRAVWSVRGWGWLHGEPLSSSPPSEQASKLLWAASAHSHSGFILFLSQRLLGICCVSGTWRLELQRKIVLLTSGQRFYFAISLVIYESKHAHSSPGLSGEKWASSGLSWSQSPLQGAGSAQAVATSKVGSLGTVWC